MKTCYGELPIILERGKARVGHLQFTPTSPVHTVPSKIDVSLLVKELPVPAYRSKLEGQYASELEARRHAGMLNRWWYEPLTIHLPGKQTHKPDFLVLTNEGQLEFHQTKGWHKNMRDGLGKLKTAAAVTPWAAFLLVTRERGRWTERKL